MQQSKWQPFVGLLIFILLILAIYFLLSSAFHFLRTLDQPLIAAILAAAGVILASTITVVVGRIFERKTEIESHFRQQKYDQYDELLKILYEFFHHEEQTPGEDMTKRLREWQRKLILFAGPKVIVAFVVWMRNLKGGNPTAQTVFLMESFFKALRADLGISNRGIEAGVLAHLILRNADLLVSLAKKNPNISLTDVGKIEEELGLNKTYDTEKISETSSEPTKVTELRGEPPP